VAKQHKELSNVLKEIYEEIIRCTQCNLCILGCPMFMGSRYDHYSPRAIVVLTRDYIEGRVALEGFLMELLYLCNLCRNCDIRCPSRIEITKIVMALRKIIARRILES